MIRLSATASVLATALVLGIVLSVCTPALAVGDVPTVEVRAGLHAGYGRLVLEWPAPVALERRQAGDLLELRFDRAFAADLDAAIVWLDDYLASLRLADDGRTLRIGVRGTAELNRLWRIDPERIVLDFVERSAATLKDPAGQVEGQVIERPGSRRLILSFAAPVLHRVEADGERRVVTFDREAAIDLEGLAAALRPLVDDLTRVPGERPGIVFHLASAVQADVFASSGTELVIDLRGDEDTAAPATTPDGPVETSEDAVETSEDLVESGLAPVKDEAVSARATSRADRADHPPAPDAEPVVAPIRDPAMLPGADPTSEGVDGPSLALARTDDGIDIAARWPPGTSAAVFVRAGVLWLAFDAGPEAHREPTIAAMDATLRTLAGGIELAQPADGFWVARLPHESDLPVGVERMHDGWHVHLRAGATAPPAVPVARAFEPGRLSIAAGEGAGRAVRMTDPRVGDGLWILPLGDPVRGMPMHRRLVQLDLIQSAHGVIIGEAADRLDVQMRSGRLEITSPTGLFLSQNSLPASSAVSPPGANGDAGEADRADGSDLAADRSASVEEGAARRHDVAEAGAGLARGD